MRKSSGYLGIAGALAFCVWAYCTDYLVPPGPPGSEVSRMRTLNEVEPGKPIDKLPFAITNSGAYIVVNDLLGVTGSNGITIAAGNVMLDLNGFTLKGVSDAGTGILVTTNVASITIRRGTVRGWGQCGINAGMASGSSYETLMVVSNGLAAAVGGVQTGQDSKLKDCIVRQNRGYGMFTGQRCSIDACKAIENILGGGIWAGSGSSVVGCMSDGNQLEGIYALASSTVSGCAANNNGSAGFVVGRNSSIHSCTASGNSGHGFDVGTGVTISECTSGRNTGKGIEADGDSKVSGCTVHENAGHGITASHHCYIKGNLCSDSGYETATPAIGIYATGIGNRLDENHVVGCDTGIVVQGSENFVVRNSTRGNGTNFVITTPAQQMVGTIQITPVSAGPWDNFEYMAGP